MAWLIALEKPMLIIMDINVKLFCRVYFQDGHVCEMADGAFDRGPYVVPSNIRDAYY